MRKISLYLRSIIISKKYPYILRITRKDNLINENFNFFLSPNFSNFFSLFFLFYYLLIIFLFSFFISLIIVCITKVFFLSLLLSTLAISTLYFLLPTHYHSKSYLYILIKPYSFYNTILIGK